MDGPYYASFVDMVRDRPAELRLKKLISYCNPLGLHVLALRYQLPVLYHQNNTCGLPASASRAFLLS